MHIRLLLAKLSSTAAFRQGARLLLPDCEPHANTGGSFSASYGIELISRRRKEGGRLRIDNRSSPSSRPPHARQAQLCLGHSRRLSRESACTGPLCYPDGQSLATMHTRPAEQLRGADVCALWAASWNARQPELTPLLPWSANVLGHTLITTGCPLAWTIAIPTFLTAHVVASYCTMLLFTRLDGDSSDPPCCR
jgi:hypothetical protein